MTHDDTYPSKFLSYVLRHQPQSIGLVLDAGGWAAIDQLIACAAQHGRTLTREQIEGVTARNDKQRFKISEDGQRIRASQGHSIPIDLGLEPLVPPAQLYHGTATRFLDAILAQGLQPQSRQHVHLSADLHTAHSVGARHGKPAILLVDAAQMHTQGHAFYRSDNGVWLTDHVPPSYLRQQDEA